MVQRRTARSGDSCGCPMGAKFMGAGFAASSAYWLWQAHAGEDAGRFRSRRHSKHVSPRQNSRQLLGHGAPADGGKHAAASNRSRCEA